MPDIIIVRIFTVYQYFLFNNDSFYGNMWIEIEANFSDWIVIQTKIEMKYIFQRVHQRLCHTILGFGSNHMKVKT